jgi:hypothetical protein
MTTAYTSLLGLALPVTGELSGTWGDTVNDSITSLLDTSVAGTTNVSADSNVTLTTTSGASNQARQAILLFSGARTAIRTVTAPAQSKIYTVINATTGGFAVQLVGAGPTTGLTIPNGARAVVAWNGSDFVAVGSPTIGDFIVNGNIGVGTTPYSWATGTKVVDFVFPFVAMDLQGAGTFGFNAYNSASGVWRYKSTDEASYFAANTDSSFSWYQAASGTAGNAITFTQAMTLNSGGYLGVGVTSPSARVHAVGSGVDQAEIQAENTSTTSGARALVRVKSASSTYGGGLMISNATDATYPTNSLLLYNFDSQPIVFGTNNAERARIDSSGNLLVGTTSTVASAKVTIFNNDGSSTDNSYLTLAGSAENIGDINYSNTFGIMVRLRGTKAGGGGNADEGYFEVKTALNGTLTGGVYISSGGTAWTAVSDERKKENLVPITNAIAKVSSLRAVTGNYIEDSDKRSKAFLIAQDVLAVLPEAVDTTNPEQYGLAYTDTIPLLVAAIKEQQAIIESLKARLDAANL